MPIIRGSTHGLYMIKEATFGTTPATPTMIEMPFTTFGMRASHGVLRSEQIRSHPFVDRVLSGRDMFELSLGFELQGATHDSIVETVFGSTIASNSMKYLDVLKGQHVHVWRDPDGYSVLVPDQDPRIGAALRQIAAFEAGCSAHAEPEVEEGPEGWLFTARGDNAFLFAQFFLALEQRQ